MMSTPLWRWGNRSVSRVLPEITEDFICSLRPHRRNAHSENLECENLLNLQQTAKAGITEDYIAWKLGTEKNWNLLIISERACTRGVCVVEGFNCACMWWRASTASPTLDSQGLSLQVLFVLWAIPLGQNSHFKHCFHAQGGARS